VRLSLADGLGGEASLAWAGRAQAPPDLARLSLPSQKELKKKEREEKKEDR